MHDMFGSLYQPIPIFDIPYAVMNRIVYEGALPPVLLGVWSSLLFVVSCYFWESGVGILLSNIRYRYFELMLCTETQKQQTKILTEVYFPDSSFDRPTDQG